MAPVVGRVIVELADAAKYAHPAFADHVQRQATDVRDQLEQFVHLDELDQALVVLWLARYAPNLWQLAMTQVNEAPCFAGGCGHPRHLGECDLCECHR